LEKSVTQLSQRTEELGRSQSQLHQTQEELGRLHIQEAIARETEDPNQRQYKLLVWDAWNAYVNGDKRQMQKCLQESLKSTPFLKTETALNWLQNFVQFSANQDEKFDPSCLTNSAEWQHSVRWLQKPKIRVLNQIY